MSCVKKTTSKSNARTSFATSSLYKSWYSCHFINCADFTQYAMAALGVTIMTAQHPRGNRSWYKGLKKQVMKSRPCSERMKIFTTFLMSLDFSSRRKQKVDLLLPQKLSINRKQIVKVGIKNIICSMLCWMIKVGAAREVKVRNQKWPVSAGNLRSPPQPILDRPRLHTELGQLPHQIEPPPANGNHFSEWSVVKRRKSRERRQSCKRKRWKYGTGIRRTHPRTRICRISQ